MLLRTRQLPGLKVAALAVMLAAGKPSYAGCHVKGVGGAGELEVYDHNRYFCVTGNRWPDSPVEIADRQAELDALCRRFWSPREVKIHRWTYAANKPVRYSTRPQPLIETK